MNDKKRIMNSLSAKTALSTVWNCIIFGIIALFVSISFYVAQMNAQYIELGNSTARQLTGSAIHGMNGIDFSRQVMDIYYSLSDEQLNEVGTEQYRSYFSDLDMSKGGTYDVLDNLLINSLNHQDFYDIYIAMYDKDRDHIVYIADADPNEANRLMPGDWEPVNHEGMMRFLDAPKDDVIYDIDYTRYGLLCTVGSQMIDSGSGELVAFMLVDISIKDVLTGMLEITWRLVVAMILVTALLSWYQTKRIQKTLVRPVNRIAEAAKNYVGKKDGDDSNKEYFAGLNIHTGDEIEDLADSMAQMEKELAEYEIDLTKATAEKERIETELTLANQIQASMLPHAFPAFPDRKEFDLYASMEPARAVGGDFYDFFLIDEDHLGLVIADVSGKGIPAALFMMIAKTIIKNCAMVGISVADILEKTNDALSRDNQTDMFVTVWIGIMEISSGKMTCANAGHEYPALKHKGGEFELLKGKHGFVIGGLEEVKYQEYTIEMRPGSKLFLYTDGVPEACDSENKMYGTKRMIEALNRAENAGTQEIIEAVRDDIKSFVGDAEQFDDMTMLCIEYHNEMSSSK